MKKLLMLLGTALFLHQGTGENEEVQNTPENNSEEQESDVQPETTPVVEDVVTSDEAAETPE